MEPIVKFLEWMQFASILVVGIGMLVGGGIAIFGLVRRKWWLVLAGVLIGSAPFWKAGLSNQRLDNSIKERQAAVRAFPKTPLPAAYPRQLIINGDLPEHEVRWLVAAGYFDEVLLFDGSQNLKLAATGDREKCRESAFLLRDPDPRERIYRGSRSLWSAKDKQMIDAASEAVRQCVVVNDKLAERGEAIILRLDRYASRRKVDRKPAPQAIEIALAAAGHERLALYEENPVLDYPASAWEILPEGYTYPCTGFADLQILINLLDSARDPKGKAAYNERRSPASKYQPCMESADPIAPTPPGYLDGAEAIDGR